MNLPASALRSALYTALSGNVGLTVYSWPPTTAGDYVLIGDIRISELTYQTKEIFECYASIEVITKQQLLNNMVGTKTTAATTAALVDAKMRPTVTTFLPVTGYTVAGCYLDDQSEDLSVESDTAIFRMQMNYFIRLFKT